MLRGSSCPVDLCVGEGETQLSRHTSQIGWMAGSVTITFNQLG